jgi:hypothetical protein
VALTPRRALLLPGLLAAAVWIQWQLIGVPPPARPTPPKGDDAWILPQVAPAQPQKAIEALNRTDPWGKAEGAAAAAGPPRWRIVGIVGRAEQRTLLISVDGQGEKQLKVGDTLPDDTRIAAIGPFSLELQKADGTKRSLAVYE